MVDPRQDHRATERGQALVEYALVVALVGAGLVAVLGYLGRSAHKAYVEAAEAVATGQPVSHGSLDHGPMVIDRRTGRPTQSTSEAPGGVEPPDSVASPQDSLPSDQSTASP